MKKTAPKTAEKNSTKNAASKISEKDVMAQDTAQDTAQESRQESRQESAESHDLYLTDTEAVRLENIAAKQNMIRAEMQKIELLKKNVDLSEKIKRLEIDLLALQRRSIQDDASSLKNVSLRIKQEHEALNGQICDRLKLKATKFDYDPETLEIFLQKGK